MIMLAFQMTGTYICKMLITCINPLNDDVRRDLVPHIFTMPSVWSPHKFSEQPDDGPFTRLKHVDVSYKLLLSEVVVLIDRIYIYIHTYIHIYTICFVLIQQ